MSTNHTEAASPADILDKAADHIEKYGWVQGDFADDPERPKECAVCARGGISVAAGCHPMFTEEPTDYAAQPLVFSGSERVFWEELGPEDQAALDLIQAAEGALAKRVAPTLGTWSATEAGDLIAGWNDADERTDEEVVAELRACAAYLREEAK